MTNTDDRPETEADPDPDPAHDAPGSGAGSGDDSPEPAESPTAEPDPAESEQMTAQPATAQPTAPQPATAVAAIGTDSPAAPSWAEAVLIGVTLLLGVGGCWSLMLAQASTWSLTGVLIGTAVVAAGITWWLVRIRSALRPPSLHLVAVMAVIAVGLAAVVLPGNRVSFAGTDPGVYVQIAMSIAETGDLDVPNPITVYGLEDTAATANFPGLSPSRLRPGRLDFAFYHLYPAIAAPAYAVSRTAGLAVMSPIIGVLGALGLTLILHRLRGLAAAAVGGGFFAFSYLWTFHSDWNGSELPTASFLLVALLAGLVAWDHERADLAVAAGLLAGIAANGRADGVLVILASVGLASTALFLGRTRLALAGLVGLLPAAVLWCVQSYNTTLGYARGHHVPGLWKVLGASAAILAAAAIGRRIVGDQRRYGLLLRIRTPVAAIYVVMLIGFWIRSKVSEPGSRQFVDYETWYPFAAERLTWFLTPVALVLFLLGLAELATARTWRPLAVTAPGLVVLPLYLWEQRVSAFMIWAMRRFVPLVWPMMGLLVGLGAAFVLGRIAAPRLRLLATGALVAAVVGPQLRWTLPLRDLDEYAGGFDEPGRIAETYGEGLYIWHPGVSHNMLLMPFLLETGGAAVSLKPGADADDLAEILDRIDPPSAGDDEGLPLFVVADSLETVEALGAEVVGFEWVVTTRLEQTYDRVPTEIQEMAYIYVVGRVER